jgi:hypothetical protein
MYLLYILFLYLVRGACELELTSLRSVKKDMERIQKGMYLHHVQSFFSSYLSPSHINLHNDICNQSSIVVVQRAPSKLAKQ